MSLGQTPKHQDLFQSSTAFCAEQLPEQSIYALLHREGHRLFPDGEFADLFTRRGRNCVPPQIVATVMVLQRVEGLSDREAVEHFTFDLRWKYAAGGLTYDYCGFEHTVLVDMRARLRDSERPNRVFEKVLEVAKAAGLVGRKRVLDSTALYDAVATQDTVTLVRSALRNLLRVANPEQEARVRAVLRRDDDYRKAGKPVCDWDDAEAREALVDALARDAKAALQELAGQELTQEQAQAVQLLATVVGQDLEQTEAGRYRIAERVAKDRVISTVDLETRHGHKTEARHFDGYKGHISLEPDSELIIATAVTPGNQSDGSVAKELLAELIEQVNQEAQEKTAASAQPTDPTASLAPPGEQAACSEPPKSAGAQDRGKPKAEAYGDASFGSADLVEHLERNGIEPLVKMQGASGKPGLFTKDDFRIDLAQGTVTCPADVIVKIRRGKEGGGTAQFGDSCAQCPLRAQCTASKTGRIINIHPKEQTRQRQQQRQQTAQWQERYKATRPKVERKFGHMMRRRHGGRRARVRGCERVGQDFAWLAAAVNLQRLATLALRFQGGTWNCPPVQASLAQAPVLQAQAV